MTKNQKISFIVLLIICLIITFIYYNSRFYNSYFFVISKIPEKALINKLKMLDDKGFTFISYENLLSNIEKNKAFKRKTVFLALENKPTKPLLSFLKGKKIPAIFLSESPINLKLPNNYKLGLKIPPMNAKPVIPSTAYISINFDDGYKSVKRNALPVLNKAGFTASTFVVSNKISDLESGYLNIQDIRDLQSAGWEISSHGSRHYEFSKLNDNDLIDSLIVSKYFLEDYGFSPYGFAFPYGKFNSTDLDASNQFYYYSRISNEYFNVPGSKIINSFAWRRGRTINWIKQNIDKAKKEKTGVTILFHAVGKTKSNYSIEMPKFIKLIKTIKDSGLPVYSNAALYGKSLFLKQEYGYRVESDKNYKARLRRYFNKARARFNSDTDIVYYPDGLITNQMIDIARQEGYKIGFGKNFGYLTQTQNKLNLKTVYVHGNSLENLLEYKSNLYDLF